MPAFVLGNGVSRKSVTVDHLMDLGAVYGCNALYRTHRVTALVATDDAISAAIQESGYAHHHRFYTRKPRSDSGALPVPVKYRGFSSGPIAATVAAQDGHSPIFLLGFDMRADQQGRFNNVYAGTEFYKPIEAEPTYTGNWQKQLIRVMQDFPQHRFVRVMGETTAPVPEFFGCANYETLDIAAFLQRINTAKDR